VCRQAQGDEEDCAHRAKGKQTSTVVASAHLAERLKARRAEIEEALRARVYAISDPTATPDPEYADALSAAVDAALDYGFAGIEANADHPPPIPLTLLVQARIAARSGISLDTVLRRYFGGYALLSDFLIDTAEAEGMSASRLKGILRTQAFLFDRLITAVSEEHRRESGTQAVSATERRLACVKRLLDGELLDTAELNYDLDAWHVAAIVKGQAALSTLAELAASLDRRLLTVQSDEATVWAWLGGRRRLSASELEHAFSAERTSKLTIAIGEPAHGLSGWRFSHRQAKAAFPIALKGPSPVVRYAEVALLASAISDNILATSLRNIYLAPLAEERDGGATLRKTLLAYLAARGHISAAAASLGVTRQTVRTRLRLVEQKIGRSVDACTAEMEIALGLEHFPTR
jgi:DNA-binding PucR family transcriptional regulator